MRRLERQPDHRGSGCTARPWFTGCASDWWKEELEAVLSRKQRAIAAVARRFYDGEEAEADCLGVFQTSQGTRALDTSVENKGGEAKHVNMHGNGRMGKGGT